VIADFTLSVAGMTSSACDEIISVDMVTTGVVGFFLACLEGTAGLDCTDELLSAGLCRLKMLNMDIICLPYVRI